MTPTIRGPSKLRIEALFLLGPRVPDSVDTIVVPEGEALNCLTTRERRVERSLRMSTPIGSC